MAINVGSFRHLISLQERVVERDSAGNEQAVWRTQRQVYAAVTDVSGREFYDAAAHQMENVVTFTFRWQYGLTNDMRILFSGAPYQIVQINHLGYTARDFMRVKAVLFQGEEQPYGAI